MAAITSALGADEIRIGDSITLSDSGLSDNGDGGYVANPVVVVVGVVVFATVRTLLCCVRSGAHA